MPAVRMIFPATGGGLPSGHTQNTVVLWGYLAWAFRRRWLTALAAVLMVLVPLSRLYLGVHFPTDLLGGYLLGAALLWLYVRLEPRAEEWVHRRRLGWQFALALVLPGVLFLLHPSADEALVTGLATLTGMGLAFVHERRWVGFEAPAGAAQRLACFGLGVVVVLALRFGLKAALTGLEPEVAFRFAPLHRHRPVGRRGRAVDLRAPGLGAGAGAKVARTGRRLEMQRRSRGELPSASWRLSASVAAVSGSGLPAAVCAHRTAGPPGGSSACASGRQCRDGDVAIEDDSSVRRPRGYPR